MPRRAPATHHGDSGSAAPSRVPGAVQRVGAGDVSPSASGDAGVGAAVGSTGADAAASAGPEGAYPCGAGGGGYPCGPLYGAGAGAVAALGRGGLSRRAAGRRAAPRTPRSVGRRAVRRAVRLGREGRRVPRSGRVADRRRIADGARGDHAADVLAVRVGEAGAPASRRSTYASRSRSSPSWRMRQSM